MASHRERDTILTKVFVGGLAWETEREAMRRYFQQFGDISEAVVITDKTTGRSKGYGFVTFREPESATRACADPFPVIDGRRTNCNLAAFRRNTPWLPPRIGRGVVQSGSPFFSQAGSPLPGGRAGSGSYGGAPFLPAQPIVYPYQQHAYPYFPYGYHHQPYATGDTCYAQNIMYNPWMPAVNPYMYGGTGSPPVMPPPPSQFVPEAAVHGRYPANMYHPGYAMPSQPYFGPRPANPGFITGYAPHEYLSQPPASSSIPSVLGGAPSGSNSSQQQQGGAGGVEL